MLDATPGGITLGAHTTTTGGNGNAAGLGGNAGSLTIADIVRLYASDSENQEMLMLAAKLSGLPESWRDYFRKRLWAPDG